MRARIVHVVTRRSGSTARREERVEVPEVTVGRGTDNTIQVPGLGVSLRHFALSPTPGGLFAELRDAGSLIVDEGVSRGGRVEPGTEIRLGEYRLRLLEAGPEEDVAIEVSRAQPSVAERESLAARTRIGLEGPVLNRWSLSWIGALALLAVFLAVPLAMRGCGNDARAGAGVVASGAGRAASGAAPVSVARPGARFAEEIEETWSVGRISTAHGRIAHDCESCHVQAFERVPDRACLASGCHEGIGAHAAASLQGEAFRDVRCTSCHMEHEGDAPLAGDDDRACIDCHRDLGRVAPSSELGAATDFSQQHPPFRPLVTQVAGSPDRTRVKSVAEAVERSGLLFPHDTHLKDGLRGPNGPTRLECSSCHHLAADGRLESKISFAKDCQSCHPLSFVDADPGRQAPHAKPDVVREAVFEAFAARALQALREDAPDRGFPMRRPGAERKTREAALASARRQSDLATAILLGPEGPCADCHVYLGAGTGCSTAGPITGQHPESAALCIAGTVVEIMPVNLPPLRQGDRWMPGAEFSHVPHLREKCSSCHPAETAHSSEVVLMPPIEKCRECHAGAEPENGKVASDCLLCHGFHHPEDGPMGEGARLARVQRGTAPGEVFP